MTWLEPSMPTPYSQGKGHAAFQCVQLGKLLRGSACLGAKHKVVVGRAVPVRFLV